MGAPLLSVLRLFVEASGAVVGCWVETRPDVGVPKHEQSASVLSYYTDGRYLTIDAIGSLLRTRAFLL